MGVKVIRIYELDGVVNARLELVGSFFEVEVPAGPVAGGYVNKRLSFEQFTALLGSNTIGGAPQWIQGSSYKEGQLVYNKGRTFRVQEDIANPQAEPLATNRYYRDLTYDDTSIYALARAIRDRVDALERNVIRWNLPQRVTLTSGGGNPTYESGDAFVVYASTASANGNLFTLKAPDYPRQGDYLGILVLAASLPIILKGLRFGSPTGPTTLTLPAGYQYEVHAATDTVGDITATYWVVHSSPGTNSSTPGTPRDLLDMTPAFLESVMALSYDVNGDAPLASTPAGSFPGQWFNGIDANGDSFRYECGRYRYRSGDTTSAGIGPAWSRQLRLQP